MNKTIFPYIFVFEHTHTHTHTHNLTQNLNSLDSANCYFVQRYDLSRSSY